MTARHLITCKVVSCLNHRQFKPKFASCHIIRTDRSKFCYFYQCLFSTSCRSPSSCWHPTFLSFIPAYLPHITQPCLLRHLWSSHIISSVSHSHCFLLPPSCITVGPSLTESCEQKMWDTTVPSQKSRHRLCNNNTRLRNNSNSLSLLKGRW